VPPTMPTSVKIGTIIYLVVANADQWLKVSGGEQHRSDYGYTHHLESIIYLNPEGSPSQTRLSLWHEILHCLSECVMGSPAWDYLGETKEDRDEFVVRAWEHATLAVMRDNPDLVAWLTD
jgi:hypothetical protein